MSAQARRERKAPPKTGGGKQNLLVIDDHPIVRESLQRLFESTGRYSVDLAVDGDDAKLKFTPGNYAVVLCDRNMRGNPKEGDDVIRRIKTMAPTQKVIMLSLTLPKGERDSIGADDYVDKNTHSDDIIAAVDRLARQTN